MHRKFITLIVAAAVAVTGISASQARAADTRDILGGLAAIAIVGAAIHHYSQKDRKDHAQQVTRPHQRYYSAPKHKHHAKKKHHRHKKHHARKKHKSFHGRLRPLPDRVARYDLPQRCLRTFPSYSNSHPLLGPNCLNKHYRHAGSLPHQCKIGFWNGNKVRRAYEPNCLRQHGYRVAY